MEVELILDSVVNYMIVGIKERFKLEGLYLISKTVEAGKVKLKFERLGFKLTVEFGRSDMAVIIYENFISDYYKDKFTLKEFNEYWQNYLNNCNAIDEDTIKLGVEKICMNIKSSKLDLYPEK